MKLFIDKYKNEITKLINEINTNEVELLIDEIDRCNLDGSSIFIIGNGGSAATASHMQNDLGSGLKNREILNLNILSLCDNIPVLTALANDVGYENIFYAQIKDRIKENDVLIAISCSGTSPNIIKAVKYAREVGSTVVGLSGFDGGMLKGLSDINYHVQTSKGKYGLVEDLHMILDHLLYSYYIDRTY